MVISNLSDSGHLWGVVGRRILDGDLVGCPHYLPLPITHNLSTIYMLRAHSVLDTIEQSLISGPSHEAVKLERPQSHDQSEHHLRNEGRNDHLLYWSDQ